jgi:hypothetical protein
MALVTTRALHTGKAQFVTVKGIVGLIGLIGVYKLSAEKSRLFSTL